MESDNEEKYFYGANLKGYDFQRANLEHANFEEANLRHANFRRAHLYRANLCCAILNCANLERADSAAANLEGADLRNANCSKTNFARANLEHADLRGANLKGAILNYANLNNADLRGADLEGANLLGAKIDACTKADDYRIFPIPVCISPTSGRVIFKVGDKYADGCFYGTLAEMRKRGIDEKKGWVAEFCDKMACLEKGGIMCDKVDYDTGDFPANQYVFDPNC